MKMKPWIHAVLSLSLVTGTAAVLPGQAFAASGQVTSDYTKARIASAVSLRTSPSVEADKIRYLKEGENVTILNETNDYWFHVRDVRGTTGYISSNSKYVRTGYKAPTSRVSFTKVTATEAARKVIAAGKEYLGTPYEFGSSRSDTKTFDCSDFVRQAYLDGIGLKLPSDSRSQGKYIKRKGDVKTDWKELEPGDIMFFMEYEGSKASDYKDVDKLSERITHNGIYIGNGKILQTYSKKSGGVRIDTIEGSQWEKRFLFGGSPL
ncbi:NlpC/P60 family protein [Paenibacillus antri]|uniref:NlpC/P60 family protein n=2 Tax=Paenibacillus antri TaxID=2582848 RepID=A0A5R9G9R9_9BACL|nr:C40 family peptidase [Paenibacillus antri]TLS50128.1 NlpC/P60 family protein [Paenibacillus antri]